VLTGFTALVCFRAAVNAPSPLQFVLMLLGLSPYFLASIGLALFFDLFSPRNKTLPPANPSPTAPMEQAESLSAANQDPA
jgi:hypothetical protein